MQQYIQEALRVNEADTTPLYLQLRNQINKAIQEGVFKPEDALPSERTLSEIVGVSRVTARKAIELLVSDGVIERRRGSGNYITPRLEQPLSKLTGFTEELRARGFVPSSRWLRRVVALAAPDEMLALGLPSSSRIAKLERVRLADQVPMAYEVTAIPLSILAEPDQVQESLYSHLQQLGHVPVRALQHIRAINASTDQANLLNIPLGQALLYITRVGYNAEGKAIELTHTYCRSDYYDFVAELTR